MKEEDFKDSSIHQDATSTAAVGHASHVLARQPEGRNPSLASAVVACDEQGDVPYGVANRFCEAKPTHRHRRRWTTPISRLTSRKAQSQQIFIYAIGIVVVGLILVFGYQAVRNISSQGEQVKAIEFRTQLANDIKGISFGDVRIREYPIPAGFFYACISDKSNFGPGACFPDNQFERKYPIVTDAIRTTNKDNIFLGGEIAPDSFALEKVVLGIGTCHVIKEDGTTEDRTNTPFAVKCFDINNGKLKLTLTGASIDYGQPRGREFGVVVS